MIVQPEEGGYCGLPEICTTAFLTDYDDVEYGAVGVLLCRVWFFEVLGQTRGSGLRLECSKPIFHRANIEVLRRLARVDYQTHRRGEWLLGPKVCRKRRYAAGQGYIEESRPRLIWGRPR
jgi:hypothetical protein